MDRIQIVGLPSLEMTLTGAHGDRGTAAIAVNAIARLRGEGGRRSLLHEAVAEILDTLQELGISDRTVVVFTSDNGFMYGEHWMVAKLFAYEESVRVPLVIWYPEMVQPREEDRLVANIDLAPTIAELAGVAIPEDVDGHSLLPLLEQEYKPGFRQILRRSAHVIRADYDLLCQLREAAWSEVVIEESARAISIARAAWQQLHLSLQRATVRHAVQRLRQSLRDVSFEQVDAAVRIARDKPAGAQATLPQGLLMTVDRDRITIADQDFVQSL